MPLPKGLEARNAFTLRDLWVPALLVTLAYVILVTDGLRLGPIPLSLALVAVTILLWLAGGRKGPAAERYPLWVPVLLLSIAVPVIWTIVALVHPLLSGGDAAEPTLVLQHASRFAYLLLYFPLCDLFFRFGNVSLLAVVVPVLGLCLVTIGIWVYHVISGDELGTTEVFVFKGVIGLLPGGFRVFIGNQIMFVLVLALLLARFAAGRFGIAGAAMFILIVVSSWLSHTRGLWLAFVTVCATTLFLLGYSTLGVRGRRRLLISSVVLLITTAVIWISVVGGLLEGPFGDASTTKRVEQAPELLDGFSASPALGSGLGGTLPSGFVRSKVNPWSFELTYLQVLFQMGVVGMLTLIAVFGYMLAKGLANLRLRKPNAWMSLAGISAASGLLAASATNPYLFSSFGMLTLAVAFMLLVPPLTIREG